jgi:hypothetical protein
MDVPQEALSVLVTSKKPFRMRTFKDKLGNSGSISAELGDVDVNVLPPRTPAIWSTDLLVSERCFCSQS